MTQNVDRLFNNENGINKGGVAANLQQNKLRRTQGKDMREP